MGGSGDKEPGMLSDKKTLPSADELRKQRGAAKPGKRRMQTAAALALVTVLAAVGVYLAGHVKPGAVPMPTATPPEARALVAVAKSELKEAAVSAMGECYTVQALEGGGYGMMGSPDFKVDSAKASRLFAALANLRYDDLLAAPEDLSAYGLSEPTATVAALFRDGTARSFLLGDRAPSGSYYYLMEAGGQDVYMIPAAAGESFTVARRQMHVAQLPKLDAGNVHAVSLTPRGQEPIEIESRETIETLGVSTLWLTSPVLYEADSTKVNAYYSNIAGIQIRGFEADATPDTLPTYGLSDPRFRLAVVCRNAQGIPETTLTLLIGDDKDDETTYARIDETSDVYLLDRASLAFLADISVAKLIDQFANIVNIAKVDSLAVTRQDGTSHLFTITRTLALDADGKPKTNANGQPIIHESFSMNGQLMAEGAFRALYQTIIGLRVDGMIPEGKLPNADAKPALTLRFQLNAIREEETIEYLPYDDHHYALRRNGTLMFYILKARVEGICQAIDAL